MFSSKNIAEVQLNLRAYVDKTTYFGLPNLKLAAEISRTRSPAPRDLVSPF